MRVVDYGSDPGEGFTLDQALAKSGFKRSGMPVTFWPDYTVADYLKAYRKTSQLKHYRRRWVGKRLRIIKNRLDL